ncbi:hypothetical protein Tco_1057514 [Tanacetum coccineum]|uniref:DNA-directed DNA polymerase n=1 Tax=Tanacetum coccineum TaxID=301880 RepID=A0ABQ5H7E0_9ASTR
MYDSRFIKFIPKESFEKIDDVNNYEVTCEEEAKRRNSGAKTKTFEESTKTASIRRIHEGRYGVSAPAHHKKCVLINSLYGVFTAYPYAVLTAVTSVKDTRISEAKKSSQDEYDDVDSFGDDADDEDEEDEEDEEHLAPVDFAAVVPTGEPASISLPPEPEEERILAMTTPSPSPPPLISLSPPSAEERLAWCMAPPAHSSPPPVLRIASTQALIDAITAALPSPSLLPLPPSLYITSPVDHRDEIHESEHPPRKRLYVEEGDKDLEMLVLVYHSESQRDSQRVDLPYGDKMTLQRLVWIVKEGLASRELGPHSIRLSWRPSGSSDLLVTTSYPEISTLLQEFYPSQDQIGGDSRVMKTRDKRWGGRFIQKQPWTPTTTFQEAECSQGLQYRDWSTTNTNIANAQKVNGIAPKRNGCFKFGAPGHFKSRADRMRVHFYLMEMDCTLSTSGWITVRFRLLYLPPRGRVESLLAMTIHHLHTISLLPPSAGERLARCMAPPANSSPPPVPSPILPSSGCPTQVQTLRIASTQALIDLVTTAFPSPPLPPLPPSLYIPPPVGPFGMISESEQPPRKRLCLSLRPPAYEIGESSTARPARGRGIDYGFVNTVDAEERRQEIRDVGYGIRDTWVDPAEGMCLRFCTFDQWEEDSRSRISQRVDMDSQRVDLLMGDTMTHQETDESGDHQGFRPSSDHVYAHETHIQAHQAQLQLQSTLIQTQHQVSETRFQMQQAEIAALRDSDHRRQAQMAETLRVMRDMRREMSDMQAELLAHREQQGRARQP